MPQDSYDRVLKGKKVGEFGRGWHIYIYMPETPPGGYLFRLQDVEKQRERRKTKAKTAERRKKKKLGNMKNPHKFVGVFLGLFLL